MTYTFATLFNAGWFHRQLYLNEFLVKLLKRLLFSAVKGNFATSRGKNEFFPEEDMIGSTFSCRFGSKLTPHHRVINGGNLPIGLSIRLQLGVRLNLQGSQDRGGESGPTVRDGIAVSLELDRAPLNHRSKAPLGEELPSDKACVGGEIDGVCSAIRSQTQATKSMTFSGVMLKSLCLPIRRPNAEEPIPVTAVRAHS